MAWQFLSLPEMLDAILTFFLAGVVPGTHIVLSPDAVMRLSAIGVGAVILLAILIPVAKKLLRKNKAEEIEPVTPDATRIEEQSLLPVEEQPALPVTQAEAFQQQMYVAAATTAATSSEPSTATAIWLNRTSDSAVVVLDRVMPQLFARVVKIAVWLQPKALATQKKLLQAYHIARIYSGKTLRWLVRELQALWRWMVPHLKQFDRWLELQIRSIEHRVQNNADRSKTASVVTGVSKSTERVVAKAKPHARKAYTVTKKTTKTVYKKLNSR